MPRLPAWPRGLARAFLAAVESQAEALAPWLAVALGVGVLGYFALAEEPARAWQYACFPLILAALLAARHHLLAAWALGLLAAAALGFAAAAFHAGRAAPALDLPRTAVVLTGTVQSVEILPEGRRVTLAEARIGEAEPFPRLIRIRLRATDPARPEPGDALTIRTLLRPPSAPTHPGAWDFQRAAWFSNLGASGFALGPATLVPKAGPAPAFAATRAAIEARITEAYPTPAGAIAAALLTGSQGAIPAAAMQAMRDSGLAHLLSVSGLHIAIAMGTSFALLRLLIALIPPLALRTDGRCWPALGALAAGAAYLLLTGLQVPMQRSFAMAALVTLGLILGRRALSPRTLAVAAVVVLLAQPEALLGPSFQMSFAAVLALIAGFEALRPHLPLPDSSLPWPRCWLRRAVLAVLAITLTSLLAGAATTPFGLHHFGRIQLYGVAANALAVPLTSLVIMPAGMLALVLMPLGLDAPALALMAWGCEAILAIAAAVAAWPAAALTLLPLPAEGLALASAGFLFLCLWRGRARLAGIPVIAAGLALGTFLPPPDILVSADARTILLRSPTEAFLLRQPGAGRFTHDAYLRAAGVANATPWSPTATLACDDTTCRFTPRPGATTAILIKSGSSAPHCGQSALLLSPEPLRPRCRESQAIDRFTVWREGPQAIWLTSGGARILSDREHRGRRPWVPPPPQPRTREPNLPALPTE